MQSLINSVVVQKVQREVNIRNEISSGYWCLLAILFVFYAITFLSRILPRITEDTVWAMWTADLMTFDPWRSRTIINVSFMTNAMTVLYCAFPCSNMSITQADLISTRQRITKNLTIALLPTHDVIRSPNWTPPIRYIAFTFAISLLHCTHFISDWGQHHHHCWCCHLK